MPNRILREGILSSDRVNKLSWPAEVFYRRLMSVVDDYGCFDGRPEIIRIHVFPLRIDKVSSSDLSKWMRECADAGLVRRYIVNNKPYVELLDFHQRLRSKNRKYPYDEQASDECQTDDSHMLVEGKGSEGKADAVTRKTIPPERSELESFFIELFPEGGKRESDKYWNHYNSVGWKVGKNKMVDWKSAVHTWLSRSQEFKLQKPKHLETVNSNPRISGNDLN